MCATFAIMPRTCGDILERAAAAEFVQPEADQRRFLLRLRRRRISLPVCSTVTVFPLLLMFCPYPYF